MRYLVTTNEADAPFLTNWFDEENHWNDNVEMVVYDLEYEKFTVDGITWNCLIKDEL